MSGIEPLALLTGGRAADLVVAGIEADIRLGRLPDGGHLPAERRLMQRFGVSRTVVREAVAALAARGLLETRPRFRPVVRQPGLDTALSALEGVAAHFLRESGGVKNLFELRICIEAGLVRQAVREARPEDLRRLEAALEENRRAIEDYEEFDRTDVAFHALLYAIPANPVFPAIHQAFVTWLSAHWRAMPRSRAQNTIFYLGHRDMLRAIVARDIEAAEAALTTHLRTAWEHVRGTFETI